MCVFTAGWFDIDDAHNHNIYVSGLPLDMTLEEFTDQMTKYGIIMDDEKGEYIALFPGLPHFSTSQVYVPRPVHVIQKSGVSLGTRLVSEYDIAKLLPFEKLGINDLTGCTAVYHQLLCNLLHFFHSRRAQD